MRVPTIVVCGPPGVGKTIVASDVSWLAERAGIPHGGLDLDAVTWMHPAPPADLWVRNLECVWLSYRENGATHLVLTLTAPSADDVAAIRRAVPGADATVVRLRASREVLRDRIRRREGAGPGAAIHRAQAERLAPELDASDVADRVLETVGRPPHEIAADVLAVAGWLDDARSLGV